MHDPVVVQNSFYSIHDGVHQAVVSKMEMVELFFHIPRETRWLAFEKSLANEMQIQPIKYPK